MLLPKTCLGLIFHSLTAVSVMRLSILFKVAVFKKICDLLDKGYNNQNIAFVLLPLHMEYYFLQFHCLNMCLSLFIHLFIYPYSLTWDYTLHVAHLEWTFARHVLFVFLAGKLIYMLF